MTKQETSVLYFNKEGEQISAEEWRALFEDREYQRIEESILPDGKVVSTVWLGSDHNIMRPAYKDHSPLIFETMVFPWRGDWNEIDCQRYATLAQAKRGHKQMVKKWKSK